MPALDDSATWKPLLKVTQAMNAVEWWPRRRSKRPRR
jgi:hypothetical protein